MSTYKSLLNIVVQDLENYDIDNAAFDARELLGKAIGVDCRSVQFMEALELEASGEITAKFLGYAQRRKNSEPLQYIIGEWEFYGLPFAVGEGVLIPRQDTETLVENAISKFKKRDEIIVIDLCSGSGCIGISLKENLACDKVLCVEKSQQALRYLENNAKLNGSQIEIINGDVLDLELINSLPMADLIISNPPYLTPQDMDALQKEVAFEPELALFGGDDGLDFYRDITRLWKGKINVGGWLMFEVGINQEQDVMKIMVQHGFKNVRAKKDLCGAFRVVVGERVET